MVPWGHGDCSLWWGVFAWVLRVKICGLEHKQDSGTFQRCYQNVLTSAFVAFTVEFPTECGHLFLGLISNGVKVVKGFIWHSEVKNQRKIWNVSTFFSVAYNLVKTRLLESEAEERERVNQTQFSFPHFVNELVPSFHLMSQSHIKWNRNIISTRLWCSMFLMTNRTLLCVAGESQA